MSSLIDNLVGRTITASIGEPWDFESASGQNRLEGKITAVSDSHEPVQWCLCVVSAFGDEQNRVTTVGIVDRYAADSLLSERLARGERVGANFLFNKNGNELTAAALRAAIASKGGLAFLVGSLKVETERNDPSTPQF